MHAVKHWSKARKTILLVVLLLAALAIINFRWVKFLTHLAKHQIAVIFCKEAIADRLLRPDLRPKEREALLLTQKIRAHVESRYALQRSTSYRTFFDLKRKALGYNITLAPALSLKAESFNFFPIGKFDYLGFFDPDLAAGWAADYRAQGYDVHLSEIGGYSTLGWFEDPLYSNQLDWGEYGLARLLGHEIAHERLYFSDDTATSELLASFIERKIAFDFLSMQGRPLPSASQVAAAEAGAKMFYALVDSLKTQLERVYESNMPNAQKLASKQSLFEEFRRTLAKRKAEFAGVGAARELSALPDINNATLIQFRRYTPVNAALQRIYDDCPEIPQEKFTCWFSRLESLRRCTPKQRKAWLATADAAAEPCPR
jgi:predicted aminopeptidase